MKRTIHPVKSDPDNDSLPMLTGGETKEEPIADMTFDEIYVGMEDEDIVFLQQSATNIEMELSFQKTSYYKTGELLSNAKKKLPHGRFLPWIKQCFGDSLPRATAFQYMKIYESFDEKTVQYMSQKTLAIVAQNKFPEETRRLIQEHIEKIDPEGMAIITDGYAQLKGGYMERSAFEKLALKQIINKEKGRAEHRINRNVRQPLVYAIKDILKRIEELKELAKSFSGHFPFDPNDPDHKKLISEIEETIKKLEQLKTELEHDDALLRTVSTPDGTKWQGKRKGGKWETQGK